MRHVLSTRHTGQVNADDSALAMPPGPDSPDLAAAHLRGPAEAADVKWRQLVLIRRWHRDRQEVLTPGRPFPGIVPLLEMAGADPRLRLLYPFTSHFTVALSSRTRRSFVVRAPVVTPLSDGRFRVHGPAAVVGHTETAEEAVALVTARLPGGFGPATES